MFATTTRPKTESDIVAEIVSNDISCVSAAVKSTGAITDFDLVGQPVKVVSTVQTLVAAADIANATGVIVSAVATATLAANGSTVFKCKICNAGPALLKASALAATDFAGAAITLATYKTALAGRGISFATEATATLS